MKRTIEREVIAGFAFALLLLVGVGVLAYLSTSKYIADQRVVVRNQRFVKEVRDLQLRVQRADLAVMMYTVTGRPEYSDTYRSVAGAVDSDLADVTHLIGYFPSYRGEIARLEGAVQSEFSFLEEAMALRGRGDSAAALGLLHGDASDRLRESIRKTVEQVETAGLELVNRRELQEEERARFVQTTILLGTLLGSIFLGLGVAVIIRDVGALRRAEARIRELNRDLESFNYSVSHDLKQPLTAIHGLAELLSATAGEQLGAEARGYLSQIKEKTVAMDCQVNGLLALARSERQAIARQTVDMDALARAAAEEITLAGAAGRTRFIFRDIKPAHGDPALLREVLVNLMSNAVKYSALREQPEVEVGSSAVGKESMWYVQDNGMGFDNQYAQRLFTPFERLEEARCLPGAGVGLAVVQRIVERHGGIVRAEGKVDRGARFSFTLPD